MTDTHDVDVPDPFEQSLEQRLSEYAARAGGSSTPEAVSAAVASGPAEVRRAARRSGWIGLSRSRVLLLAGVLLVSTSFVAGIMAGRFLERDEAPQAQPSAVADLSPKPSTPAAFSNVPDVFALSGRAVERWDAEAQAWDHVVDAETGWVSPHGQLLGYDEGCDDCWLMVLDLTMPLDAQVPRRVFERVDGPQFGGRPGFGPSAWSPDGRSIARLVNGTFEVVAMPVPGQPISTRDPLASRSTSLPRLATARRLEWSPDSRSLALVDDDGDIHVIDAASGASRQVTSGGAFGPKIEMVVPPLVWSPDGESILTSDGDHAVVVTVESGAMETLRRRASISERLGWTPDGQVTIDSPNVGVLERPPGLGLTPGPGPENGYCHGASAWAPTDGLKASVWDGSLYLGEPASLEDPALASNLCGAGDEVTVTWSPDGEWIAVEASDPMLGASFRRYTVTLVSRDGERIDYVADDRLLNHELRWVE